MPGPVLEALRRNWWTFVLRGVCAILFGFFAWFWPGLTLLALILTWATLACINGVTTLVSAENTITRGCKAGCARPNASAL